MEGFTNEARPVARAAPASSHEPMHAGRTLTWLLTEHDVREVVEAELVARTTIDHIVEPCAARN